MANILSPVAGLFKSRILKTEVDGLTFQLHYRLTAGFLYVACGLVVATEFIGNSIYCHGSLDIDPEFYNTFCWISSTFTINTTDKYGFKGLGHYNPKIHERTFHNYYQFVPYVLFIQGVFFALPHAIWKSMEGKRTQSLLQGLQEHSMDEKAERKWKTIVEYFEHCRGRNNTFSVGYFFCECLNLANLIAQMFLLNEFFGGMFLEYGSKILSVPSEDEELRYDHFTERFPRRTKCTFHKVSDGGSLVPHDFLCILPQNILNEKIFLAMWIWFVTLGVITGIKILLQTMVFASPIIRLKMLEQRGRITKSADLQCLVKVLPLGDFFLLHKLGRNLDAVNFRGILNLLCAANSSRTKNHLAKTHLTESGLNPNAPPVELANYETFRNDLNKNDRNNIRLRENLIADDLV